MYEASGVIKTTKGEQNLASRIKIISSGIHEIIEKFEPQVVAIEKVFLYFYPQSTLLLGQARGAAIGSVVMKNLEVFEYTALQVKKSVAGNGHADKIQVLNMVQRLLEVSSDLSSDSADALACAICHANMSNSLVKLGTGNRMKAGRII